jgi:hypothetical protein
MPLAYPVKGGRKERNEGEWEHPVKIVFLQHLLSSLSVSGRTVHRLRIKELCIKLLIKTSLSSICFTISR